MVKVYRKSKNLPWFAIVLNNRCFSLASYIKEKKPLFAPAVVLYSNDRLQTPCLLVVLFQLYTVEGDFV